jgi:hypothetical protein
VKGGRILGYRAVSQQGFPGNVLTIVRLFINEEKKGERSTTATDGCNVGMMKTPSPGRSELWR